MPEPINIGDTVRILPPFNAAYPGTYTVIAHNVEASAYTLEGVGDFDAQYLEVVS